MLVKKVFLVCNICEKDMPSMLPKIVHDFCKEVLQRKVSKIDLGRF